MVRRALLPAFFAAVLAGCTGVVSEKPVFAASDFDTTGALLGHYTDTGENRKVLVTRGPDGQLVVFGFENKPVKKGKETEDVWYHAFYAEGAAVALGGGDYVLQISCSAIAQGGKTYAGWLGGKSSPYRDYTAYGVIAQDRQQDHLWFSANFYRNGEDAERVFARYGAVKPKDRSELRILPPDMPRAAATAMFRELIAFEMAQDASPTLYRRADRNAILDAELAKFLVIKDSTTCRRLQRESEPPKDK
jgi:hypothetical protein